MTKNFEQLKTSEKYPVDAINEIFDATQLLLNSMYTPPTVGLSTSPNVSVKEYGDPIASISLTATTTKQFYPIKKVEFYRQGTLIHSILAPNADGGAELYTDSAVINDTVTFMAKVYDQISSSQTSKTISFVSPFYVGVVNNPAPTESEIKALTKLVKTRSDTSYSFNATNSRFVISYPKSYGTLNSILDKNGFETISSYARTEVVMAGLDGNPVTYYVYTLSNITTQTNFLNTFKF